MIFFIYVLAWVFGEYYFASSRFMSIYFYSLCFKRHQMQETSCITSIHGLDSQYQNQCILMMIIAKLNGQIFQIILITIISFIELILFALQLSLGIIIFAGFGVVLQKFQNSLYSIFYHILENAGGTISLLICLLAIPQLLSQERNY